MNNPLTAPNGEGADKSLAATPHGIPPTVSGLVRIDVSGLTGHDLDRAIQALAYVPAGAPAELLVAPGQHYPASLEAVRREAAALITVVCSDPATVARWVHVLREGFTWLR